MKNFKVFVMAMLVMVIAIGLANCSSSNEEFAGAPAKNTELSYVTKDSIRLSTITVKKDGQELKLIAYLDSSIIHRERYNIGIAKTVSSETNRITYSDGNGLNLDLIGNIDDVKWLSTNARDNTFEEMDSLTQIGTTHLKTTLLFTNEDSIKEIVINHGPMYQHVRPADAPGEPEAIIYTTTVVVEKIVSGNQLYAEGSITIDGSDGSHVSFTSNVGMIGRYNDAKPVVVKTGLKLLDGTKESRYDEDYGDIKESYRKGSVETIERRQKITDNRLYENPAGGKSGMAQNVYFYTWDITFITEDGRTLVLEMTPETEFLEDLTTDDPSQERTLNSSGEVSTYAYTLTQRANHYLSASLKVDGQSYPVTIKGLENIDGRQLFKYNEASMPIYTRD